MWAYALRRLLWMIPTFFGILVINFGVLYGMSAFGLAKELGITQKLAQAYIDGYFQKYAKVRDYLDGLLAQARREGYVTTLLRRRRYLPEINSPQPAVRQ